MDEAKDGPKIVRDAKGKEVAILDKDKTLHVHSKHGEYTEAPDGKIKFETKEKGIPAALHKPGTIPPHKYEDYGISSSRDGKTLRFPNGVEHEKGQGGDIIVSAGDYPGFNEQPKYDVNGIVQSRTGYDGNGKVIYISDSKGLHIPTANGTLTRSHDGKVSFQPNKP